MMVTHSGTNEITNKVETLQKIRKVIKRVKENYQVSIIRLREIRRVSEIILKYNHIFIKNLLKFIIQIICHWIVLNAENQVVLKLLKKSPKRRRN